MSDMHRALVARGAGSYGLVMWASEAITEEMDECCVDNTEDLGMATPPVGLSIWEGVIRYAPAEDAYDVCEYVGVYRPLTAPEWERLIHGGNPLEEPADG